MFSISSIGFVYIVSWSIKTTKLWKHGGFQITRKHDVSLNLSNVY